MSLHFIDAHSRILFIEGLIETLASVFHIEDEVQKAALYNELTVLDDVTLLEKQKIIESYLEEALVAEKSTLQKLKISKNKINELDEKSSMSTSNIF